MAETKTTAAAPAEAAATYTAAELIAAAPAKFGVSPDVAHRCPAHGLQEDCHR